MTICRKSILLSTWLLLLLCLPVVTCDRNGGDPLSLPSEEVYDENGGRLRGIRNYNDTVDFVIGALIPVHREEPGSVCSTKFTSFGIQRLELFLYLLDRINRDSSLLPNVTIGYDVRDTCFSRNIALDESLDLLIMNDVINTKDQFSVQGRSSPSLIAVVGATGSSVSIPVAGLYHLFRIPQISYLSTSSLLSDRERYEYFLRTVPPDNFQAAGMYQLLVKLNWTLISVVFSDDEYGTSGVVQLRNSIRENNDSVVCIDFEGRLGGQRQVAQRLVDNSEANVIVLFSSTEIALDFLKEFNNIQTNRSFQWIVSDAVTASPKIQQQSGSLLHGMLGFIPNSVPFMEFERFFKNVTLQNNVRNENWYEEYCRFVFNTSLCNESRSITESKNYVQDKIGMLIVDAVYSIAVGLDEILKEICGQPLIWNKNNRTCVGQNKKFTREVLLKHIQQSTINSPTGSQIMFDSQGNSRGNYSLLNLQRNSNSGYQMVNVGNYDTITSLIDFTSEKVVYSPIIDRPTVSRCDDCLVGFRHAMVQGSCCYRCVPCLGQMIANTTQNDHVMTCSLCPEYSWGKNPLNGSSECVQLPVSYIGISHPLGIFIVILVFISLLLIITTAILIGIFWKTPVIKSSGREQMILLLIALTLSTLCVNVYIIQPSFGVCLVRRLSFWFCLSLILGTIAVKLIRITRIFLQVSGSRYPRFIEPQYQIIFTFLIVFGKLILVAISLAVVPPLTELDQATSPEANGFPTLWISCQLQHTVMIVLLIVYDTVLIILINALAIFTYRFPENFNEVKHILFCTFAIGIIWIVFIPILLSVRGATLAAMIALGLIISSISVLVCLFGPRIYVAVSMKYSKASNTNKHGEIGNDFTKLTIPNSSSISQSPTPVIEISTPSMQAGEN